MRSRYFFLAIGLTCAAACSIYGAEEDDPSPPIDPDAGDEGKSEASIEVPNIVDSGDANDGGQLGCDRTKPFGNPVPVPGFSTTEYEATARLTQDERIVYWARFDNVAWAIWTASRATKDDSFATALKLSGVNDPDAGRDFEPSPSENGLELYFMSERLGGADIFRSTRGSVSSAFSDATKVDSASGSANDRRPYLASDGKSLWFDSDRNGASRIYRLDLSPLGVAAPIQIELGALSDTVHDEHPVISNDGLALYFGARGRDDANTHVYMATRANPTAPFGKAVRVVAYNGFAAPSWISADECRLYVSVDGKGAGLRVHMVERAK